MSAFAPGVHGRVHRSPCDGVQLLAAARRSSRTRRRRVAARAGAGCVSSASTSTALFAASWNVPAAIGPRGVLPLLQAFSASRRLLLVRRRTAGCCSRLHADVHHRMLSSLAGRVGAARRPCRRRSTNGARRGRADGVRPSLRRSPVMPSSKRSRNRIVGSRGSPGMRKSKMLHSSRRGGSPPACPSARTAGAPARRFAARAVLVAWFFTYCASSSAHQ